MKSSEQYDRIISIVHHNTTPAQPPMIHAKHVRLIACSYMDMDRNRVNAKLRRAVEKGDLIRDGDRFVSTDPDRVDRAIEYVVQQVPVNQSLLGRLNAEQME